MTETDSYPYELSWIGASAGCLGLSVNNKPVLAGTRIRVGLRHLAPALGYRPESIYIFQIYDRFVSRVVSKLGKSPTYIDRLPLERCATGDFASQTGEWLVTPPSTLRGRLKMFCSTQPDGSDAGPTITSVSYITADIVDKSGALHQVNSGGLEFVGLPASIELGRDRSNNTTARVTAAVDPELYLEALVPHSGNLDKYLYQYLGDVAVGLGMDADGLFNAFMDEYRDLMHRRSDFEIDITPRYIQLEEGESKEFTVRINSSQPLSMMFAVRATYYYGNASGQSVSDLIEVISTGDTEMRLGFNIDGSEISQD